MKRGDEKRECRQSTTTPLNLSLLPCWLQKLYKTNKQWLQGFGGAASMILNEFSQPRAHEVRTLPCSLTALQPCSGTAFLVLPRPNTRHSAPGTW